MDNCWGVGDGRSCRVSGLLDHRWSLLNYGGSRWQVLLLDDRAANLLHNGAGPSCLLDNWGSSLLNNDTWLSLLCDSGPIEVTIGKDDPHSLTDRDRDVQWECSGCIRWVS